MVSDGNGWHAQSLCLRHQLFDGTEAIQKRVSGVDMEVDK